MIKLLLSWDIRPEQDQEHFEFLVREFAPRLTAMGIKPIEAWFTIYGRENGNPQIIIEAITDDLAKMREILGTSEWEELKESLLEHVDNFTQRVVRGRPHLQL
jgi:hypothetical protein